MSFFGYQRVRIELEKLSFFTSVFFVIESDELFKARSFRGATMVILEGIAAVSTQLLIEIARTWASPNFKIDSFKCTLV